ncbi:MAG: peptide deformylase [Alphaproteobacteria bacterium CG_4_10_14_0_2_um_filter_63_37]|nr:MAG: peptide deformylase [Proteobacteria bacterium CG1_02_64_396]PJA24411.1 MAG: peptide deformylase [Alphaproteobacteria bacterium CG_4_10_14_0_2_um_filter_63_37]
MAIREILIWPDDRLKKVSKPIERVDDTLRKVVKDMADTMYDAPGVGLAAPQVDVHLRLLITDIEGDEKNRKIKVIINPEIVAQSGSQTDQEGCLSVPGVFADVERADWVKVRYRDLDWNLIEEEATGLQARAFQHEIDHLDGIVFVELLSPVKRRMIRNKMLKLKKERTPRR